jgi:hypothetical protein
MKRGLRACVGTLVWAVALGAAAEKGADLDQGLAGYWKLQGDCRDYSGKGNHGVNHGVNLQSGTFDGISAYVEVPSSSSLKLGIADFALSAWVYTEEELDDVVGDVVQMYDPSSRRGMTLSINSSSSGYQGQGSDRNVYFGIDNARQSDWEDCGRPSRTSPYVSNSMVVYQGNLYVGITDAKEEIDWCHVFRYDGNRKWIDCGRVGIGRTTGVGPLIVHDGALYAVTWTYDWTRVKSGKYDAGRVYRYDGETNWVDCGQPSDNRTLNCAASYKGTLYVGGGPESWGVFVRENQKDWKVSKIFSKEGPQRCFPHAMSRHNGKLYTAYPAVYSFDGSNWCYAGLPGPLETVPSLQTHAMTVFQGKLCAGTWPEAKVARYLGGEEWEEFGRVGVDGTEINALLVYNGKLYGGSIPRAEVCRYDGSPQWTSLKRFYSPEGWRPGLPGKAKTREVNEWSRVTAMTVYGGKLFAGIGNCTSSILDSPTDVRGHVFSMEAGKCVSYDHDLGPGWKHLAAVREGGHLKLYVNGQPVATSSLFEAAEYDLSTDQPFRIGFGQMDYFSGKISKVRIYTRALSGSEIEHLASEQPRSAAR